MPQQDTTEIREKILSILRRRGPSLPVHIAKETGLSMLFASAFLSELLSEKKIRISSMKIGSSPVYFLPGQEPLLTRFSNNLKSKEKDAYILLRDKKFLLDREQDPAIRVALRSIRDFAVPFKDREEIVWRFHNISEIEYKPKVHKKELGIFEKSEKEEKPKIKKMIKKEPKKKISKIDEKFFNKVKEFLIKRDVEILDIENFSKKEIILKISGKGGRLLVAYNKKRITEADIIKAHKRAIELKLPYIVLSLGEPTKKLSGFIEAIKDLQGLERIR